MLHTKQAFLKNTILLFAVHPKFYISIVFNFPCDSQLPQEKFNTMFMQNFRETTKSIIVNFKNACGGYLVNEVVYQATVTTQDAKETYISRTATQFKARYRNHQVLFRQEKTENGTEHSKHYLTDYHIFFPLTKFSFLHLTGTILIRFSTLQNSYFANHYLSNYFQSL